MANLTVPGAEQALAEKQLAGSSAAPSLIEQAAIVLLSMGEEQAAAVLGCLDREELLQLTKVMSRMSGIRVEAVKHSLQHFFDDYRQQSGVHGASRSFLQRSLGLALGQEIAGTVLDSIYGDEIRPKMSRLQWASPRWLAERLAREHPRMQAMFLAFLPSKLAGEVIDCLPEAGREQLILNVARVSEVDRDMLVQLEELTQQYIGELGTQGANVEGTKQAADILNRLQGDKLEMVSRLRAQDPQVAAAIEDSMYDFFILSRQPENVLASIIEVVPVDLWALALKGAEPAVRSAIFSAMPRRQAQGFEEQMRRSGPVPITRALEARREIMAQVKAMVEAGEIEVQLFAEAVVE